ncbi:MAG TPA: MFS transporter [Chloroflexota bacterium]|jgi:MFS family permease|nr:MFS transporter [Chloroflexota bacterium]
MVVRYRAVFRRHPDFLKLWSGQSISSFGSAVTTVALPLTAVLALNASPVQMGLLAAMGFLPHLALGLPAGVWVDRWPRRPILIVADLCRAVLLGSVPTLAVLGALRIEYLYVVSVLIGACTLLFDVAATSYLPALVSRDDLLAANSASALSGALASTAGPALAGGLVQLLTAPVAIVIDAVSYLVSALWTALIRTKETPSPPAARRRLWSEIGEGIGALISDPILRPIIGASAVGSFGGAMRQAVLVLYLVRSLGLTPTLLGLAFAASGAAAALGALLAGPARDRFGAGPAIVGGTVLWCLGNALIPLAGGPVAAVVLLVLAAQVISGVGTPIYSINQITVRQAIVPYRLLGRVNASRRFLVFGVIPLGALLGGAVGQVYGLRPALIIGVAWQALSVLWLLLSPVRLLRDAEGPLPGPSAA